MPAVEPQEESFENIVHLVRRRPPDTVAQLVLVCGFDLPSGSPRIRCSYVYVLPAVYLWRHGTRHRDHYGHSERTVEAIVADDQSRAAARKFGPDDGAEIVPADVALSGAGHIKSGYTAFTERRSSACSSGVWVKPSKSGRGRLRCRCRRRAASAVSWASSQA